MTVSADVLAPLSGNMSAEFHWIGKISNYHLLCNPPHNEAAQAFAYKGAGSFSDNGRIPPTVFTQYLGHWLGDLDWAYMSQIESLLKTLSTRLHAGLDRYGTDFFSYNSWTNPILVILELPGKWPWANMAQNLMILKTLNQAAHKWFDKSTKVILISYSTVWKTVFSLLWFICGHFGVMSSLGNASFH